MPFARERAQINELAQKHARYWAAGGSAGKGSHQAGEVVG
jgi:hypothetical protein